MQIWVTPRRCMQMTNCGTSTPFCRSRHDGCWIGHCLDNFVRTRLTYPNTHSEPHKHAYRSSLNVYTFSERSHACFFPSKRPSVQVSRRVLYMKRFSHFVILHGFERAQVDERIAQRIKGELKFLDGQARGRPLQRCLQFHTPPFSP
eukprot:6187198-Pleurochrysis_carterae.AAC.2